MSATADASVPDADAVAAALEAFVRERFLVPDDDPLFSRRVDLWDEGYVDSPGVVEVLAFLEERFGMPVPEEALFRPEFTTIEGMAQVFAEVLRTRP